MFDRATARTETRPMEPAMRPLLRGVAAGVALAMSSMGAVDVSHAQATAVRTAQACQALRTLELANTSITVADSLSGTFVPPGTRDTIRDLPPFCRVAGE